jgi:serine/threonine protein kinase
MTYGIHDVTNEEWEIAKQYFEDNPEAVKARRYRGLNNGVWGLLHSFVRMNGQIYAIARKEKIGRGGFGSVKRALAENGQLYALKVESIDSFLDKARYDFQRNHTVHQDLDVMKKMGELFGHTERKSVGKRYSTDKKYILQRLIPGISLSSFIQIYLDPSFGHDSFLSMVDKNTTRFLKLSVAIAIAEAIKILHDQNIIHCDIKPENVLIDYDGYKITAHLIDMDRSVQLNPGETCKKGSDSYYIPFSTNYAAPELSMKSAIFSKASDVYAFAWTAQSIDNNLLFHDPYKRSFASNLKTLILKQDPEQRPEIASVINHLVDKRSNLPLVEAEESTRSKRELLSFFHQMWVVLFNLSSHRDFLDELNAYICWTDFEQKNKLDVFKELVIWFKKGCVNHAVFHALLIEKKVDPDFVDTYLRQYQAAEDVIEADVLPNPPGSDAIEEKKQLESIKTHYQKSGNKFFFFNQNPHRLAALDLLLGSLQATLQQPNFTRSDYYNIAKSVSFVMRKTHLSHQSGNFLARIGLTHSRLENCFKQYLDNLVIRKKITKEELTAIEQDDKGITSFELKMH